MLEIRKLNSEIFLLVELPDVAQLFLSKDCSFVPPTHFYLPDRTAGWANRDGQSALQGRVVLPLQAIIIFLIVRAHILHLGQVLSRALLLKILFLRPKQQYYLADC